MKAPQNIEYEKTFWPFCIFSKKRYFQVGCGTKGGLFILNTKYLYILDTHLPLDFEINIRTRQTSILTLVK